MTLTDIFFLYSYGNDHAVRCLCFRSLNLLFYYF